MVEANPQPSKGALKTRTKRVNCDSIAHLRKIERGHTIDGFKVKQWFAEGGQCPLYLCVGECEQFPGGGGECVLKVARGSQRNFDSLKKEAELMKERGKADQPGQLNAYLAKEENTSEDGLYSLKDERGNEYERVYYYVSYVQNCDLWDITYGWTMPSEFA